MNCCGASNCCIIADGYIAPRFWGFVGSVAGSSLSLAASSAGRILFFSDSDELKCSDSKCVAANVGRVTVIVLTGAAVGGYCVYKAVDKIFRIVQRKDGNYDFARERDHHIAGASSAEIINLLSSKLDVGKMV